MSYSSTKALLHASNEILNVGDHVWFSLHVLFTCWLCKVCST